MNDENKLPPEFVKEAYQRAVATQLHMEQELERLAKPLAGMQKDFERLAKMYQPVIDQINRSGILEQAQKMALLATTLVKEYELSQRPINYGRLIPAPEPRRYISAESVDVESIAQQIATRALEMIDAKVNDKVDKTEIFYNPQSCTLSRNPTHELFAEFSGSAENHFTIIKELIEANQFIKLENLRRAIGKYKSNDSLRKAIGKINIKFLNNLQLEDRLIIGQKNRGYSINPKLKIIKID